MIRFARRFISLTFLVALLVAAAPGVSHAGAKTLARSVQNLLFFPFDLALSPFVAHQDHLRPWRDSDDTKAVKYGYALFAPIWNFGVEAGASVIRGVAGCSSCCPASCCCPSTARWSRSTTFPSRNPRWVDVGAEAPFRMKFGVDYLAASSD